MTRWIAAVVVILTAAGAIAADLYEPNGKSVVDPATVLTIALVGVTAYSVLQNRDMLATVRRQVAAARAGEVARQREVQILEVHPFLVQEPNLHLHPPQASLELQVREPPALHIGVIMRAFAEIPDPGSSDGRSAQNVTVGSWPPGTRRTAVIPVDRFLTPGDFHPFEDVWQVEISHLGLLGQRAVETYEWQIAALSRGDRSRVLWQLRRLQIQPSVSGATSVDQRFGDE